MASKWHSFRLGEVCSKIGSGATPRGGSSVYLDEGEIALIRSQNVYNDAFQRGGLVFLTEAHADELANVEVKENDVLLNITGDSVARSCQVSVDVLPARVNQHVAIIRPNPSILWPRFLRYHMVSPATQAMMLSLAGAGATRNALTKGMIESFELSAPVDVAAQRNIAHILGTLDDKIELNHRSNATLEAMARALFKDWCCNQPTAFPRETIAQMSRDGVLTIGDGYRAKNDELGSVGLPFIRAGELKNGFDTDGADILSENSVRLAGDKVSRVGDVAFTSKGTIGRFARVTKQTPAFVYSPQVCFWRATDATRLRPEMLYLWMVSDDCRAQIDAVAGQTDMALYVSLRDQRAMTMPIFGPAQHVVADLIKPLLARQATNSAETRTLATLRDTLLPKLLSGELRVRDAERQVETVL